MKIRDLVLLTSATWEAALQKLCSKMAQSAKADGITCRVTNVSTVSANGRWAVYIEMFDSNSLESFKFIKLQVVDSINLQLTTSCV